MKTAFAFLLAVSLATPIAAQNAVIDLDKQADEMAVPIQDISARYWAQRVQSGEPTLEQLEENSKYWIGTKEANKKLIKSIKKYLKSGKKISVTDEEYNLMRETNSKIGDFVKKNKEEARDNRNKKIDELNSTVRDIQARVYAKQVQDKLTTIKQLEEYSKNWLGSDKENKALIDLVKKYVKAGKPITITDEEQAKLDENRKQLREFLDGGKKDSDKKKEKSAKDKKDKKDKTEKSSFEEKMVKIDKIQMSVLDIEARSWAIRIVEKKDMTFEQFVEKSNGWIGKKEYKEKLQNKVEENIKEGSIKPLSDKETEKLNQATLDIREILK